MKTLVKRIGILAAAFALLSLGVYAQEMPTSAKTKANVGSGAATQEFTTPAATTAEGIDTVTVGSTMQYTLDPIGIFGVIPQYKWVFTGPAGHTWEIQKWVDKTATPPTYTPIVEADKNSLPYPAAGSVDATFLNKINEIVVKMPETIGTGTDGNKVTLTNDIRYSNSTTVFCPNEQGAVDHEIRLVPAPKVEWEGDERMVGVCIGTPVIIPNSKLTGYSEFEISYGIQYFPNYDPVTGMGVGTVVPVDQWLVVKGDKVAINGAYFTEEGMYQITVNDVTDRISRKSLEHVAGEAPKTATNAADPYYVYIYPTPDASTIILRHVKNMP